jgi:hypothetical protein
VVSPQTVNGTVYEFTGWNQGGAATQTLDTPTNDAAYTANFRVVTTDAPLRTPDNPAGTVAGLAYAYYEGVGWNTLPNFAALVPAKTGTVTGFDLAPRTRDEDFAFRYTGYVQVSTDGVYTFSRRACRNCHVF